VFRVEAKLYYLSSNRSLRKVVDFLESNQISYESQLMVHNPLSWEQLFEILLHTENGVEDVLSTRSKAYKELIGRGIEFDKLKLTEFHAMVVEYPTLIKSPITVAKNTTVVGYDETEITMLADRKTKKEDLEKMMKSIREKERNEYAHLIVDKRGNALVG
jgi:Spx/MgsR family transcriptional regulator